ncbi:MAG: hypothetical protein M3619_27070, partial [Myxococcota bacterium]|nr:hypothetical protein [Myxococcota bacterium]
GWVPPDVVGNVWVVALDASPDRKATHVDNNFSDTPARDGRPRTQFVDGAVIRRAARADAAPIAKVIEATTIGAVVTRATTPAGWAEIEIVRPYARIRGHVLARELRPDDGKHSGHGSGGGSGFGMSHADRLAIPASTCLFDAPDGQVVGVQLAPSTRLGRSKIEQPQWSKVYVDTPWDVVALYVRNTATDPAQPVWESCAATPAGR